MSTQLWFTLGMICRTVIYWHLWVETEMIYNLSMIPFPFICTISVAERNNSPFNKFQACNWQPNVWKVHHADGCLWQEPVETNDYLQ